MTVPRAIVGRADPYDPDRTLWRFWWCKEGGRHLVQIVRTTAPNSSPCWTCHVMRWDPELRADYPVLVHPGELPPIVGWPTNPLKAWRWGKEAWREIGHAYGVVLYEPGMVPSVPKEGEPKSFTDAEWNGHGARIEPAKEY